MKKLLFFMALISMTLLCACGNSAGNHQHMTTSIPETTAKKAETTTTEETTTEEPPTKDLWSLVKTYAGSGDQFIELEPFDESIWAFYITGNEAGHHFAVTGYDKDNNYVELFVNTADPYSGVTFDSNQETALLEIKSAGDWQVNQFPIGLCDTIGKGETYQGSGDTVLLVRDYGFTAHIIGPNSNNHFAIITYKSNLGYDDLLVNVAEPYEGQVRLDQPAIIVVKAVGDWSIEFE